jgi:hypothetical protein
MLLRRYPRRPRRWQGFAFDAAHATGAAATAGSRFAAAVENSFDGSGLIRS